MRESSQKLSEMESTNHKTKLVLPPININNHTLSSPIYAAAMQDHFARSLSLNSRSNNKSSSYKPILNIQKRQLAKWNTEIKRKQCLLKIGTFNEPASIRDLEERVLDPLPKPLSLAQKLGIVSRPKDRLTEPEWTKVKIQSQKRNVDKCPICCESFTIQDQILLSCSHIYHRSCLESYEKHVFKKSCPLCRTEDYEKRLYFEGKKSFYHKAAIKIQSTFRMWLIKRQYLVHLQSNPPSDPRLRKKYFLDKLTKISTRAESLVLQDTIDVNEFLLELDASLSESRKILESSTNAFSKLDNDWEIISKKAQKRIESCPETCSICISALDSKRSNTLLNCSHVFHDKCISTFEKFIPEGPHLCPICRHQYTRIAFSQR